jgi:hypothetical protein
MPSYRYDALEDSGATLWLISVVMNAKSGTPEATTGLGSADQAAEPTENF